MDAREAELIYLAGTDTVVKVLLEKDGKLFLGDKRARLVWERAVSHV
jgi:hypothetical protein